ncbi:MAG: ComEC/Rec2 family competence protein [Leptolyngbya sp. SIO1E4]|nr:ComEC/Rec2 family competence protein [Leptolyngbya sp. SIO1E4]
MVVSLGVALCVAYIVGLLCTGIEGGALQLGRASIPGSSFILFSLTLLFALVAPRRWKLGLRVSSWLCVAGVGALATLYISLRSPVASPQDISTYVKRVDAIAPTHLVVGRVITEPRLNRDLKGRFRLAVNHLKVEDAEGHVTFQIPVQGRLYVTAPLLQVTGLHAGQRLTARGQLYLPQAAMNPNGFDFQTYLAKQQIFAGFQAQDLQFSENRGWGLWRVRQRIVRTQVRALGSPLGQLVSAMALGRRAVDLPFDIQDLFSQVGLAHTIAASGFHVSLLLGTVLALLRSRPGNVQLVVGLTVLAGYVTLTGLQASVMRAALMGSAALLGLAMERQVKPLGALLFAVTILLLWDPNWIWDIGFQLSVTATFGLIVMVPIITQGLDGLPVGLTSWVAVPISATLWTLPLMLYHFNVISGLSIALNAIATPLVTVMSLGGIGSSALALLSPAAGQLVASLLYYPAQGLLWLARTSRQLPGSAIAIGQISIWQLAGLYGVLILGICKVHHPLLRRGAPAIFLGLLLLPMGWQMMTQYQVTVLAAGDELIWVMREHGRTTLVNSGTEKTTFYTVRPFLQQAGINHIETAIALPFEKDYPAGWQTLWPQIPVSSLYGSSDTSPLPDMSGKYQQLNIGQSTPLKNLLVQSLGTDNPILRLTTPQQTWLLLPALPLALQEHLANAGSILQSQILVWNGDVLSEALLAAIRPEVVICYGRTMPQFVERQLRNAHIQVHWTARDGAITWDAQTGFQGYRDAKHRNMLPWG